MVRAKKTLVNVNQVFFVVVLVYNTDEFIVQKKEKKRENLYVP